jgi:hypothetical protein
MTAAWIALAAIGIGLPLGAWWVGGRPVWARSDQRARRAQAAHREWVARHGLTSAELAEVQSAVARGAAVQDPRLRASAVEEARRQLGTWGARGDVAQRVWLVLGVLWIGAAVILIVVTAATGDWSWHFLVPVVNVAAIAVPQVLLRRNLRRAIYRNSAGAAAPHE